MNEATPDIDSVRDLKARIAHQIVETPVVRCAALSQQMGGDVTAKLEFLQQTGTFKARGALSVLLSLDDDQRRAGVTTVSAGNHAIATAFAAKAVNTHAKVVMLASANPARVEKCREYGAEVVMVDDIHESFDIAERIQRDEGRFLVHPFEGPYTFLGTATVGLEMCEQIENFDAIIVPIGGGGLCAGIASVVKQLRPDIAVYGVEPEGADCMCRSFASGKAESIDRINTIADSLGAPFALPQSFEICRDNIDKLVTVSDGALRESMRFLFREMKIAVEPACAASTAALTGPLAAELQGRSTALVMCGSNIDWTTFAELAGLPVR